MQEKFELLKQSAKEALEKVVSTRELPELKAKFIGKNGEVTSLLRGMKDVPAEKRAENATGSSWLAWRHQRQLWACGSFCG